MSLERELDKTAKNVRDAVDEAKHRAEADAERAKRELDPTMTESERIGSSLNEARHGVQADVERAKRDIRNDLDR
jgi:DNA-binding transcriptional regulator GbsR (MarR family)